MNNTVSIYIPNLSKDEFFDDALDSVRRHTDARHKLFHLAAVGDRSCARNHNAGIAACLQSGTEYIAQINGDCEVIQSDWLEMLVETMELLPNIGMVGPKLVMADGTIFSCGTSPNMRNYHMGEIDRGQREFVEEVVAIPCNCYLYRREALLSVKKWFDPLFIKSSAFVDTDLCMRLRKKGWRVYYDGRVKVLHKVLQTQGSWHSWNHLYFHLKHPSTLIRQYR